LGIKNNLPEPQVTEENKILSRSMARERLEIANIDEQVFSTGDRPVNALMTLRPDIVWR